MIKKKMVGLMSSLLFGAVAVLPISAQEVITEQELVVGPTANGWKFPFQITRFVPTQAGDTLTKVTLELIVNTTFPGLTATAGGQAGQQSDVEVSVTETVNVKNLRFTADD